MMGSRVGSISLEQLTWAVLAILLPAVIALLALGVELWQLLDRPLYTGRLVDREFAPSLARGFLASVVYGALLAGLMAAGWSRKRVERRVMAAAAGLVCVSVVVLAPLTHAVWLADAVDASRLWDPVLRQGLFLDLFAMTASEWAQAAPYVLLSLYAIAALTAVVGLVAFHAKQRTQTRWRLPRSEGWSMSSPFPR